LRSATTFERQQRVETTGRPHDGCLMSGGNLGVGGFGAMWAKDLDRLNVKTSRNGFEKTPSERPRFQSDSAGIRGGIEVCGR